MRYQIELKPKAIKDLKSIPNQEAAKIIEPYEEFLQIQEALEDFEDLIQLRKAKEEAGNEPAIPLDELIKQFEKINN